MEGDGIGGAVNLIMKDAPSERQFTVNLSTGYNAMYFDRDFQSFNHGAIVKHHLTNRWASPKTTE